VQMKEAGGEETWTRVAEVITKTLSTPLIPTTPSPAQGQLQNHQSRQVIQDNQDQRNHLSPPTQLFSGIFKQRKQVNPEAVGVSSPTHPPLATILLPEEVFFQAKDGIRDWSVTGVQTCALPI